MTTCHRCQRPACDYSTRACVSTDCGLRAATMSGRPASVPDLALAGFSPIPGRDTAASTSAPAGAGGYFYPIPSMAGRGVGDQLARNREAYLLRCSGKGVSLHEGGFAA